MAGMNGMNRKWKMKIKYKKKIEKLGMMIMLSWWMGCQGGQIEEVKHFREEKFHYEMKNPHYFNCGK